MSVLAQEHASPVYNAGVRNALVICSSVQPAVTRAVTPVRGGDFPFAYGLAPVTGAPYSAVGVRNYTTTFVDGNRITRQETTRFFRDTQGRTRIELTPPPTRPNLNWPQPIPIVVINDPVTGECAVLDSAQKIAHVVSHPTDHGTLKPPIAIGMPLARLVGTGFDLANSAPFEPMAIYGGPVNGSQIELGEKTIEHIATVGVQLKHQVRAGEFGNEQPITVTVEQWFSPELGTALLDTQHSSIGGEIDYRLEQITRSEPDGTLFKVPSDYTRKVETLRLESRATVTPALPARPMQRPPTGPQ